MPSAVVQKIATASLIECLKMVRCGFELETQTVAGESEDNYCSEYDADDDYQENWDSFVDEQLELPDGMDWCHDGSVDGVEIRTVGASTASQFLKAAKYAFDLVAKKKVTVDDECSFHIHISFPGITHQYSERFQRLLIEGLMKQSHTLPASVLKRWQNSSWRDQYFPLHLSQDKYSFINYHERLKTWEFRCFGNVQTFHEAVLCLKAAVNAFRFAYRVTLKLEKCDMANNHSYSHRWKRKLETILENTDSFAEFNEELNQEFAEENKRQKEIRKKAAQQKLKEKTTAA